MEKMKQNDHPDGTISESKIKYEFVIIKKFFKLNI